MEEDTDLKCLFLDGPSVKANGLDIEFIKEHRRATKDRIAYILERQKESINRQKQNAIVAALNATKGNRKQAARDLRVSYHQLLYTMDSLGISVVFDGRNFQRVEALPIKTTTLPPWLKGLAPDEATVLAMLNTPPPSKNEDGE